MTEHQLPTGELYPSAGWDIQRNLIVKQNANDVKAEQLRAEASTLLEADTETEASP